MSYYSGGIYQEQGTGNLVVPTGKMILPASGTQAAHIADVTSNAAFNTAPAAAVNSIIAALENVGILATS